MDNIAATAMKRAGIMVVLLFTLLMVFGCAGGMPGGGPVTPDDRILFTGKGSGEGVYSEGPLTVRYRYSRTAKTLHLAGDVDYPRTVSSLNVYVPIIDGSGNVLNRFIVYYSGYRVGHWLGKSTFQEDLALPPDAAGFSFGYSALPGYVK